MNSPEPGAGAGDSELRGVAEMGEEPSSIGEGKNEDIFCEVLWGETAGDAEIEEGWTPAPTAAGDKEKKTARDKATQKLAAAVAIVMSERAL